MAQADGLESDGATGALTEWNTTSCWSDIDTFSSRNSDFFSHEAEFGGKKSPQHSDLKKKV